MNHTFVCISKGTGLRLLLAALIRQRTVGIVIRRINKLHKRSHIKAAGWCQEDDYNNFMYCKHKL